MKKLRKIAAFIIFAYLIITSFLFYAWDLVIRSRCTKFPPWISVSKNTELYFAIISWALYSPTPRFIPFVDTFGFAHEA